MYIKGFVVAGDARDNGTIVWKVRVKDRASNVDGKKLVVASVHEDIALAKGLNVIFQIGTVTDAEGQPVLRAVDVRLQ